MIKSVPDIEKNHQNVLWFSPKRVVKVGFQSIVPAIAAEERYDVLPWVPATASKSKYGRELLGRDKREREIREMVESDVKKPWSAPGI